MRSGAEERIQRLAARRRSSKRKVDPSKRTSRGRGIGHSLSSCHGVPSSSKRAAPCELRSLAHSHRNSCTLQGASGLRCFLIRTCMIRVAPEQY